jgi:alanyl-tRNA synthetase
MKDQYPDLVEKRAFLEKAILAEEEQFLRTLERGLILLDEETAKLGNKKGGTLPGEIAFKLYDTYGFPLDLTRVICAEKGIGIDEPGFEKSMDRQRSESRKHWKGSGQEATSGIYLQLAADLGAKGKMPKFVGYDQHAEQGACLALLAPTKDAMQAVDLFAAPSLAATADSAEGSPIIEAVFSKTPFYGESGGQQGDRGRVTGPNGFEGEVIDVQKPAPDFIVAHIRPLKGTIRVGETYLQETDAEVRALTARNHTATHLLHWALREVLGKHVKQAGSLVAADLLRFDFSHFQPMTDAELLKIEDMINVKIWAAQKVLKQEMPKEKAIAAGAMAMFGEKYGDVVRVVQVGDFSTELCGGTHVDNSSDIHLFKIGNESGIAAGVRRIIAYTSKGAFDYLRKRDAEVKAIRDQLNVSTTDEIPGKLEKVLATEKELRKQIESFNAKNAAGEVDGYLARAKSVGAGTKLVATLVPADSTGAKRLRDLAEIIKQKQPDCVVVLGMKDPETGKASLLVAIGPKAPKIYAANDILKELSPFIEGKGGGKPDMAQAGGTKAEGLQPALAAAEKLLAGK